VTEIRGKLSRGIAVSSDFRDLEEKLILLARQANRGQRSLPGLESLDLPESSDAKTKDAARLFLAGHARLPYYYGYDVLVNLATNNVQQLLSLFAAIVDRMIYRSDLGREKALSPKHQEDILKRVADEYYLGVEESNRSGAAIRQLVDNLGRFCNEVTYRPNAPIAPGVNGFGVTPLQLQQAVAKEKKDPDADLLRKVLTNAVAGNVLSVRPTKQGQAGSEKIVFYLNRVLCMKYDLPLNYGGWQPLSTRTLAKMMKEPLQPAEIKAKLANTGALLDDTP
jgi:hypothetical protein